MDPTHNTDIEIEQIASYRYSDKLPEESLVLAELLETAEIQQLFEFYYHLINIPIAIIDLKANVLLSSRWRRICIQFHRVHPATCSFCIDSDTHLTMELQAGENYPIYPCKNDLTDCASPIVIDGKHVANVFIGQFLTREPDEAIFRQKAKEFGFDTADYLAALHGVPIVDEKKIPIILDLLTRMTRMITNLSVDRKRAIEDQARHSIILDTIPQTIFWKDIDGKFLGCNASFAKAAGFASPNEIFGKTDSDLPGNQEDAKAYRADDLAVIASNKPKLHIVEPLQKSDGSHIVVETSKVPLMDAANNLYGVLGIYEDKTEQKKNEEDLRESEELFRTAFESSIAGISMTTVEGRFIKVNNTLCEMLGYDPKEAVEKLRNTLVGTVNTIAQIVEKRDPYTSGHQERVAEISVAIANELGLPNEQIQGIYLASLVHDLGKIQIPEEILIKPGKLTELEFKMIKIHPAVGYELLKSIEFPWPIAEIVYQHHERMDGSGYPKKLTRNQILVEARIIGVADVVEAMSSYRPYRAALGLDAALGEINKNKGILYDPVIAEAFFRAIKEDNTKLWAKG